MALPNNAASSLSVSNSILPPDDLLATSAEDFERGGAALNNAATGLNVRNWRCYLGTNGSDVYVQAEGGVPELIFSVPGISGVTFTFDQLMRPVVAYTLNTTTYLRWFDTLQNAYITTELGELLYPRLSFDDKRATQYGSNGDIILAYLRSVGGSLGLYYRQQRDRFNIEYALRTGLPNNTRLRAVGMNRGLRMQFELV